jgi:hypothetical protein
MLKFDSSLI